MRSLVLAILGRIPGVAGLFGRARFERLVGRPVPSHVTAVTAMFDLNITFFEFDPPFDRDGELRPFDRATHSGWPLHRVLLADHVGEPTRNFHRKLPPMTTVWLYLNDQDGRGAVLGIP